MKLAVTDANIFIDLMKLRMLDLLFQIEAEIHTAKEVLDQLNQDQYEKLNQTLSAKSLFVHSFSSDEILSINSMTAPRSLDLVDKAVVFLALGLNASVLTGDGPLRKFCKEQNLEVKGIIWLFDIFFQTKLISPVQAAAKMKELIGFNDRFPKKDCMERINSWETQ
jgi:predicted nucleic acid-binding protein